MDSARLKEFFEKAFDVHVTQVSVHATTWSDPVYAMGSLEPVTSIEQAPQYNIDVTCCFIVTPPEYSENLTWFDMRDCGHALHFVRTNNNVHTGMLELRYRTSDFEKFINDLADARYRRFNRHFHKQLEDILD